MSQMMFHTIGLSLGLNLQLVEMYGGDRKLATEMLFKQMDRNMKIAVQSMLKEAYKGIPVNEVDCVAANRIVEKYLRQMRTTTNNVKSPPPDTGSLYGA